MTKTKEEIQKEYNQTALVAGDLAYKLAMGQSDLEAMYQKMKSLNLEAQKIIESEKPQAVEAEVVS